jgi:hypothetical protein
MRVLEFTSGTGRENMLDGRGLANYRKLRRENALAAVNLAEKRARERDFGKMVERVKPFEQGKGAA